jgi:hypothetical protein
MWKLIVIAILMIEGRPMMGAAPQPGDFATLEECQQAARELRDEHGSKQGLGFACVYDEPEGREA